MAEKKRVRSPNYPYLDVQDAIERLRNIYEKDKRASTTASAILEHMGYKTSGAEGKSGSGGRAISALRQYGLLDENNGNYNVSELGFRILHLPDDSSEKQDLIKQSAVTPIIFKKMLEKYSFDVPSDTTLRSHLILNEGFNPDTVKHFIRVFRHTIEFANLTSADYNSFADENDTNEDYGTQQTTSNQSHYGRAENFVSPSSYQSYDVLQSSHELKFRLSADSTATILFSGEVTQKAIQKLISLLNLSLDTFPEDTSVHSISAISGDKIET